MYGCKYKKIEKVPSSNLQADELEPIVKKIF
jgi:hypothetical protein